MSKGSCESLCVLDLEAYLCAAVYQSKLMIEIKSNINSRNDSVLSYPPDIIDALCTAIQASWWKAAYGLYTASIKYVYFFPLITLFCLSLFLLLTWNLKKQKITSNFNWLLNNNNNNKNK